ncbi:calcium-binding protein [Methylibium sp.]|uniref:calcium-binding protein n=1 Tax=Methylibium sp. TaxID=2067992 RepID=UPI0017EA1C67|nr:calcium-binding protein [Methylibium sp.]MBA3588947.1 hypothetical protein [Methylibium sp.]
MGSPGSRTTPAAYGQGNEAIAFAGVNINPIAGDGGSVIEGGAGNDRIDAGTGADVVHGGDDDDFIAGMDLADVLYGDAGNDSIVGDGTQGPSGAYTAIARHGDDILIGGAGEDVLWGQGGSDALYGGDDADQLFGDDTSLIDTPLSMQGQDYLDGGAGADQLTGGGRDDTLFGGIGDDALWGDGGAVATDSARYVDAAYQGNDYLSGGEGDDYLQGEGWDDSLFGGTGNDVLIGDDSESRLGGAAQGRDYLDGGDGNDELVGGGGADTLLGGAGNDQLQGDADTSEVSAALHGGDLLDGGSGSDTLWGGGGDDHLSGGSETDGLYGGTGNDSLYGGSGSDVLLGEDGNDVLDGGAGADDLRGGTGDDVYVFAAGEVSDGTSADSITDIEGTDIVQIQGVSLGAIEVARTVEGDVSLVWGPDQGLYVMDGLRSSVEAIHADGQTVSFQQLVGERLTTTVSAGSARTGGRVLGGANNDGLNVTHAGNRIAGGRGDDIIGLNTGLGSIAMMSVGDGMDQVTARRRELPAVPGGPAPENVLQLGAGFDSALFGIYQVGSRSFVLLLNEQGDGVRFSSMSGAPGSVAPGDEPFDLIRLSGGAVISWQEIPTLGVVTLPTATQGNDLLVLSPIGDFMDGLGGNDRIEGLAGNDSLRGGDGSDTLFGGLGNDTLNAGSGVDSLVGGAGDDHLYGGTRGSFDFLEGGEGNDQYFFHFGLLTGVEGQATDESRTSDDVYSFADTGSAGGVLYESFSLTDMGGNDRIRLDSSYITPANTVVRYTGTGLSIISLPMNIHIEGAIDGDGVINAERITESVVFRNGTVWTPDQLRALSLQPSATSDTILGYDLDDVINGGAGYDRLYGGRGKDTLNAGPGGGTLTGGAGDDVYVVRGGDGEVFVESPGRGSLDDDGLDVLEVMTNRDAVTVSFDRARSVDRLVVEWKDGSASAGFDLVGTQPGASDVVEEIRFLDGTSIDVAQFVNASVTIPTQGMTSFNCFRSTALSPPETVTIS